MKRTHRNLLIICATALALWGAQRLLPPQPRLVLLGCVFVGLLWMVWWGRAFYIGRSLVRRRDWRAAFDRFQHIEQKLLAGRLAPLLIPLHMSIYTFDGVAVCRNNMAMCLMNIRELDKAERYLRLALYRDSQYALAYLNLGTIAALRGDSIRAEREFRTAVELGYSASGAQRLLRAVLAKANITAGRSIG